MSITSVVRFGKLLNEVQKCLCYLRLKGILCASTHELVCCFADPEWASYTLGVFVCHSCSGLHRNIAQISKVKSVLLDPWSSSEVEVRTTV